MEGIIILAHGSKREETIATLDALVAKIQAKIPQQLVYPAYLQFVEPALPTAVQELVSRGVTQIKVAPLFLFDGIHVAEDIPNELESLRQQYPQLELKLLRHLGADDRIADVVLERIAETSEG